MGVDEKKLRLLSCLKASWKKLQYLVFFVTLFYQSLILPRCNGGVKQHFYMLTVEVVKEIKNKHMKRMLCPQSDNTSINLNG